MKRPNLPVVRTAVVTRDELSWTSRPRPKHAPVSHRRGKQRGRKLSHNAKINILLGVSTFGGIAVMIVAAMMGVELYG